MVAFRESLIYSVLTNHIHYLKLNDEHFRSIGIDDLVLIKINCQLKLMRGRRNM